MNQKRSELLTYKLNEIKLITLTEMGLPEIFGTSVFLQKDLKIKYDAAVELESLQEEMNVRFSVSTSTWNNVELFRSFQLDIIYQLNRPIGKKKRSVEVRLVL